MRHRLEADANACGRRSGGFPAATIATPGAGGNRETMQAETEPVRQRAIQRNKREISSRSPASARNSSDLRGRRASRKRKAAKTFARTHLPKTKRPQTRAARTKRRLRATRTTRRFAARSREPPPPPAARMRKALRNRRTDRMSMGARSPRRGVVRRILKAARQACVRGESGPDGGNPEMRRRMTAGAQGGNSVFRRFDFSIRTMSGRRSERRRGVRNPFPSVRKRQQ